jgi:hypothetical protein
MQRIARPSTDNSVLGVFQTMASVVPLAWALFIVWATGAWLLGQLFVPLTREPAGTSKVETPADPEEYDGTVGHQPTFRVL